MSTAKRFRMENGEAVPVNQEFDDETTRKRKLPSKKPSTIPQQKDDSASAKTPDDDILKEALMANFEDNDEEWCTCKQEVAGTMVECADSECEIKKYHKKCLNLKRTPKNTWICKICREKRKSKKSAAKQQSTPKPKNSNAEPIVPDESNEISKKSENQEENETLNESNIKNKDVPSREITDNDIENAKKRDRELRNGRREARGTGTHLNHYNEHWLKLAGSSIHGLGMFAIKDIAEDTQLIEYTGQIISKSEIDKRETEYKKEGISETYFFTADDKKTVIDSTKEGSNAKYINHSCDPNVYSRDLSKNGQTKIIFYAAKQIFKGQELTMDYCFDFDPKEEGRIECKCGATDCKKYLDL